MLVFVVSLVLCALWHDLYTHMYFVVLFPGRFLILLFIKKKKKTVNSVTRGEYLLYL